MQLSEDQLNRVKELDIGMDVTMDDIRQMKFNDNVCKLIAVGDVTCENLWKNGVIPDISVYDGYTKRSEYTNFKIRSEVLYNNYDGVVLFKTRNPKGNITKSLFNTSFSAVWCKTTGYKSPILIEVDGEEDLAVIPLMVCAYPYSNSSHNYSIIYGQPNVGMRIINVTNDTYHTMLNSIEDIISEITEVES